MSNDAPIPDGGIIGSETTSCTFSTTPLGRETHPLSCVTWDMARAFCRFEGGDLPGEAEWEYAALGSARPLRTRFPWGGSDDLVPPCGRTVYGRGSDANRGQRCNAEGLGPLPVDARLGPDGDVTPGLGIVGLGGNIAEYTREAFSALSAVCWASRGMRDPGCDVAGAPGHVIRGGTWHDNAAGLVPGVRRNETTAASGSGFRCMRKGRGP